MCCLKESLLSNHIPKYLQEYTLIKNSSENFSEISSLAMQNLSNLDFVAFTVTLLYFIQWSTLSISFWNSSLLASGFLTIAVSSAKSVTEEMKTACGRSLIYIKNSNGPKTEPWGTPHLTWRFVLTVLLIFNTDTSLTSNFWAGKIYNLEFRSSQVFLVK